MIPSPYLCKLICCFYVSIYCSFDFPINELTWHATFCEWLLLCSMLSGAFHCAALTICLSFFFCIYYDYLVYGGIAWYYPIVGTQQALFLVIGWALDSFYFWGILKSMLCAFLFRHFGHFEFLSRNECWVIVKLTWSHCFKSGLFYRLIGKL